MADQQGGILAKSGLDSIKVGGKKIPIALIGGIAAVVGVVLFIRARQSGQTASVGSVPAAANTGVNPVVDSSLVPTSPDYSAALTNLNQQLVGIQQSLASQTATQTPATTTAQPTLTLRQRFQTASQGSLGYDYGPAGVAGVLPLYTISNGIASTAGQVQYGANLLESGNPLSASIGGTSYTFVPVGGGEYVSQGDINGPPH